jgi:hypothetical protein
MGALRYHDDGITEISWVYDYTSQVGYIIGRSYLGVFYRKSFLIWVGYIGFVVHMALSWLHILL